MIEITFNNSIAGSLVGEKKIFKNKNFKDSYISVFVWNLDIGYLKDGIESEYRKSLPDKLLMQGYYADEEDEEDRESTGELNLKELDKVMKSLDEGEEMRIWYSLSPDSLCGFYHFCSLLEGRNNKIYQIKCPETIKYEDTIQYLSDWGRTKTRKNR